MNILNIELYSIILIFVIYIDYKYQFKNNFNSNSYNWFGILLSIIVLSLLNICLEFLQLSYIVTHVLTLIFYCLAIVPPLLLSLYLFRNYFSFNQENYNRNRIVLYSIAILYVLTVFFHTLNMHTIKSLYEVLMLYTYLPLLYVWIEYFFLLRKKCIYTYKVFTILLLCAFGLFSDVFFSSLSFLTLTYVVVCIMLYMGKYDEFVNKDHLTGVYNRRYIDDYNAMKSYNNKDYIAVCFIDVDKFKSINDTYGHQIGDEVLINVSNILKKSVRLTDAVIRYGGDEFLVIAKVDVKENIKKIVDKIDKNVFLYNKASEIKISLSVGYDVYDSRKMSFQEFIKSVDKKMYDAKSKKHSKNNK